MRALLLSAFLLLLSIHTLWAQGGAVRARFDSTDAKGRRQGMWILQQPARMGEPAYTEFGSYQAGQKSGAWYKLDNEGNIAAVEHYRFDVLNGAVKYYDRGALAVSGFYYGMNPAYPFDTIYVPDPVTGQEFRRIIPTDHGSMKDSTWRFYQPETGRLIREEFYSYDELISKKEYPPASGDSAYYNQRFGPLPQDPKKFYKPPRGKGGSYTH